ncbi:MAG: DASS family sodium-coupled anion symporter [Gemmatimonadales bacterium]|nr:DASS family sodium-coupled anion symporter [Gemmatimonadales bacterium]NIO31570.1 DASS family sodium-coupled anion symporter [Gemmatimonadota bacterium]
MSDSDRTPIPGSRTRALIRAAIPVAVGAVVYFIPPPEGVDVRAMHLLGIFIATIVGLMLKPLPMGAVAMIGICATAATQTLTIGEALTGFSNRVIWLIVLAFFISRGFIKTGLGARIAYLFMARLGRRTLGLSYGLIATDLVLAPAIPSNTARAGGVIFPILRSVAEAYQSRPEDGTARRIGAFLTKASFQGTVVTSAMFLTAMAANPLAAQLARDQGVRLNWTGWALAALLPGLLSLCLVPYLLYRVYPPEIKETPQATELARQRLREMGSVARGEWVMLGCLVFLLTFWMLADALSIHTTVTAMLGLVVLLASGVLEWEDILREKSAWDTLVWFAALVMMASFLTQLGFIPWFSINVSGWFSESGWLGAFLGLSLIYFYSHYFFASNTAHVSAMYAPFLGVAIAVGTPPLLAALVLAFFSNLFSSMTHYGTGPAPVLFGSGYVEMADWWRIGLLVSVVNLAVWLGVGGAWWKLLGIW